MLRFLASYNSMIQPRYLWFTLALALAPISVQSAGVFFVVPNNLLNTNGNDASRLPFSYLGQAIEVKVPFFYDPTKGNLLFDLRSLGIDFHFGDPTLDAQKMDAQTLLGDSISRVAAFSLST